MSNKHKKISNQKSNARIREQKKVKNPQVRQKKHSSGAVLRDDGDVNPSDHIFRNDPPPREDLARFEAPLPRWEPDWKINRTYTPERLRFGRQLPMVQRPFSDMSPSGPIRYSPLEPVLFNQDSYKFWMAQEDEPYMRESKLIINKHVPNLESMLDIEGGPFFMMNWECRRTLAFTSAIRRHWRMRIKGITFRKTNFNLKYIADKSYDVVVVFQFYRSNPINIIDLFRVAKRAVLITYPYQWKEGPVHSLGLDEKWVFDTFNRAPTIHKAVEGSTGISKSFTHDRMLESSTTRAVALFKLDKI